MSLHTLKEVYDLAKFTGYHVCGHDGLPITNLVTGDKVYFLGDVAPEQSEEFDYIKFYEACIPSICRDDLIAGEVKLHKEDGIIWIGVDLYRFDKISNPHKLEIVSREDQRLESLNKQPINS